MIHDWDFVAREKCFPQLLDKLKLYPYRIQASFMDELCKQKIIEAFTIFTMNETLNNELCNANPIFTFPIVGIKNKFIVYK